MLYQRRLVPSMVDVGEPAALPANLQGLTDDTLADLTRSLGQAATELGYTGHGFFPATDAHRWLHASVYVQRFTAQERIAIQAARAADPILNDLLYVLERSERISLDHADIIAGLGYLVSQGLIEAGRPAQLRA